MKNQRSNSLWDLSTGDLDDGEGDHEEPLSSASMHSVLSSSKKKSKTKPKSHDELDASSAHSRTSRRKSKGKRRGSRSRDSLDGGSSHSTSKKSMSGKKKRGRRIDFQRSSSTGDLAIDIDDSSSHEGWSESKTDKHLSSSDGKLDTSCLSLQFYRK